MSAFAGKTVGVRLRCRTDGAVQGNNEDKVAGFFADELVLTGASRTAPSMRIRITSTKE